MNNYFAYSLLKYQYSAVLGEVFNIGLLISFPYQESHFIYPKRLHRLKEVYAHFEENHIRAYLEGFKAYTDKLNKADRGRINFEYNLENYIQKIANELIAPDDSALYFGQVQKSVLYTTDLAKILDHLYQKYFFPYEKLGENEQKKDESYLIKSIKEQLKGNEAIYSKFFQQIPKKAISNTRTSLEIELYWQNGTTHLIQPISFDLQQAHSIDNKANRFFSKFYQLKEEATKQNSKFDAVVCRPVSKDLFKAYDKAIQILEDAPCTVIEEKEIPQYSADALNELASHL